MSERVSIWVVRFLSVGVFLWLNYLWYRFTFGDLRNGLSTFKLFMLIPCFMVMVLNLVFVANFMFFVGNCVLWSFGKQARPKLKDLIP